MATRFVGIHPQAVPSSTFGRVSKLSTTFFPITLFAINDYVLFVTKAPVGITGTHTAKIQFAMVSATTGNVAWRVEVQAVTAADALDLDASTSYDTANNSGDTAVGGTAGYMTETSLTLSNMDGVAAGDYLVFKLTRITPAGSSATGDAELLSFEWQDGA